MGATVAQLAKRFEDEAEAAVYWLETLAAADRPSMYRGSIEHGERQALRVAEYRQAAKTALERLTTTGRKLAGAVSEPHDCERILALLNALTREKWEGVKPLIQRLTIGRAKARLGRNQPKEDSPAGSGATSPALDNIDLGILTKVARRAPELLALDDLDCSRGEGSQRVRQLEADGLLHRPKGKRNGFTVTESGKFLANAVSSDGRHQSAI